LESPALGPTIRTWHMRAIKENDVFESLKESPIGRKLLQGSDPVVREAYLAASREIHSADQFGIGDGVIRIAELAVHAKLVVAEYSGDAEDCQGSSTTENVR